MQINSNIRPLQATSSESTDLQEGLILLQLPKEVSGENPEVVQATAYLGGFILLKCNVFHLKQTNSTINDSCICHILVAEDVDLSLHLYNTFKEYDGDSRSNLKYCSETLVLLLLKWEAVFQYVFTNYKNIPFIKRTIIDAIKEHAPSQNLCKDELYEFLLDLYVRTRLFHSVKVLNSQISKPVTTDKMKKITGL